MEAEESSDVRKRASRWKQISTEIIFHDAKVQCLQHLVDPRIRDRAIDRCDRKPRQRLDGTEVGQSDEALAIPRDLVKFEKETAVDYLWRWRARELSMFMVPNKRHGAILSLAVIMPLPPSKAWKIRDR